MKPEADIISTILDNPRRFSKVWVFAYGSLLWKPCFQFQRQLVGHIKGFKRRFFQGNTNFRGSPTQPGRVAILVPDKEEVTWGVAYEIVGREHVREALEQLYLRENDKGGYFTLLTSFHPRDAGWQGPEPGAATCSRADDSETESDDSDDSDGDSPDVTDSDVTMDCDVTMDSDATDSEDDVSSADPPFEPSFPVLAFSATSASNQWLGEAEMELMAQQIALAKGIAGSNAEYVFRTAEYIRRHIPEDGDSHLFELEQRLRELVPAEVPESPSLAEHQRHLQHHHLHQASSHHHRHLDVDLLPRSALTVRA